MKLSALTNAVPAAILRSPIHRLLSKRVALLSFVGRRSGKEYTIPVVYVRRDGAVLVSTDSPWWKNLRPSAPVRVRLEGRWFSATASPAPDPATSEEVLDALVAARPSYAGFASVPSRPDGSPDVTEAVRAGRIGITIELRDQLDTPADHP